MGPASDRAERERALDRLTILCGDAVEQLRTLPSDSVHLIVTSPPYWGLRDYNVAGQIGMEEHPEAWVDRLVEVFREARRVLRSDGVCYVNVGDAYSGSGKGLYADGRSHGTDGAKQKTNAGSIGIGMRGITGGVLKPKDLIGLPWMLAFALRADGWYLRQDIIYAKPNPMPESVADRCTKSHEYVFMLTKSARYWYDAEAIKEPAGGRSSGNRTHKCDGLPGHQTKQGLIAMADTEHVMRNKRDVWTIALQGFAEAHFATFPEELPRTCIMAACPERCCAVCGAGWVRVYERTDVPDPSFNGSRFDRGKTFTRVRETAQVGEQTLAVATGWRPSCECGSSETAPGVVLDPFLGSGTTALVALKCGRHAIGIELNPEYADMARKRCEPVLAVNVLPI